MTQASTQHTCTYICAHENTCIHAHIPYVCTCSVAGWLESQRLLYGKHAWAMSALTQDAGDGELPPWKVCKAVAFHTVLKRVSEVLETPAADLLGQRVEEFIASELTLEGGGAPQLRCVRKAHVHT